MKQYLSMAWRVFKHNRKSKRMNDLVRMKFQKTAEVTVEDIKDFFKLLKPINSGLPMVRLGSEFDGGYVLPDDFDGTLQVFRLAFLKPWILI